MRENYHLTGFFCPIGVNAGRDLPDRLVLITRAVKFRGSPWIYYKAWLFCVYFLIPEKLNVIDLNYGTPLCNAR